jgi:hypothetical protein
MHQHLTSPVPSIADVGYRRACPASLEAVIRCCLEKTRDKRYATMNELLGDLKSIAGQLQPGPVPVAGMQVIPRFEHPKVGAELAPSPSGSYPPLGSLYDSYSGQDELSKNFESKFSIREPGATPAARMGSITEPNPIDSGTFAALTAAARPPPPPYVAPAGPPRISEHAFVGAEISPVEVSAPIAQRKPARTMLAAAVAGTAVLVLGAGALVPRFVHHDEERAVEAQPVALPPVKPIERAAEPLPKTPDSADFRVVFESSPPGARVREGGAVLGITPFIRDYPRPSAASQRAFVFDLDGYEATNVIAVFNGERLTVRADLAPASKPSSMSAHAVAASRRARVVRVDRARTQAPIDRATPGATTKSVQTVDDRRDEVPSVDEAEKAVVRLVD